jgi:hypothetical protein
MEETRPSNQRPVVSPVETLKELCLEEFGEYRLNEYRLQETTESLKAFVDLVVVKDAAAHYQYYEHRIIWITDSSFVCMINEGSGHMLPDIYRRGRWFLLRLLESDSGNHIGLSIHSSTVEEAISCLDVLVGIHDPHFQSMWISYYVPDEYGNHLCPLPIHLLEKVLDRQNREIIFGEIIFTREQCHALAAGWTNMNLGFYGCKFEDGGAAFLEASCGGPTKLSIKYELPFDEGNLALFSKQRNLECLTLEEICFRDGSCWIELMEAISTLPSLHTLHFGRILDDERYMRSSATWDRTMAFAGMVSVNKHVDKIIFDSSTFNPTLVVEVVSPILECNLYRKRFAALSQKIELPSSRAAVVARALAHVAKKPSLLWMALSQNHDILCSYLDEASTDAVTVRLET